MDQDQIAVGMQVRYPRTGTTGAVVSLTTIRGDLYAEVETTHLLYRVDQLIAAEAKAQTGEEEKQDIRTILEKEREALTRLDGSQIETDNSCEGGG
ncbi:DUF2098 domain-containing protein [Methanosphaerula subterraneus]|uniref:DUF2098 domain-containing protein n=1 Tax=Methanosphaerula subterraneus TaxID=3350244 RepID=UPI003F86C58B